VSTNGNGHVPTRIVELLITNLNELSKHVQELPSASAKELRPYINRVESISEKILDNLQTPPRNNELLLELEELNADLKAHSRMTNEKVLGADGIQGLKNVIKSGVAEELKRTRFAIKVGLSIFAIVMIVASVFMKISNQDLVDKMLEAKNSGSFVLQTDKTRLDRIEKLLEKHLKDSEKLLKQLNKN